MKATGRAVVHEGPREPPDVFRLVEYPRPEPEPGAVVLQMTLANICGSDMHGYLGEAAYRDTTRPRHLGHEGVGRVAALGPGVTADSDGALLAVGDRVVFGHFYPCGRCRATSHGAARAPKLDTAGLLPVTGPGGEGAPAHAGRFRREGPRRRRPRLGGGAASMGRGSRETRRSPRRCAGISSPGATPVKGGAAHRRSMGWCSVRRARPTEPRGSVLRGELDRWP
jgi:hypothetical protein